MCPSSCELTKRIPYSCVKSTESSLDRYLGPEGQLQQLSANTEVSAALGAAFLLAMVLVGSFSEPFRREVYCSGSVEASAEYAQQQLCKSGVGLQGSVREKACVAGVFAVIA